MAREQKNLTELKARERAKLVKHLQYRGNLAGMMRSLRTEGITLSHVTIGKAVAGIKISIPTYDTLSTWIAKNL